MDREIRELKEMLAEIVTHNERIMAGVDAARKQAAEESVKHEAALQAFGLGYAYAWSALVRTLIAQDTLDAPLLEQALVLQMQHARSAHRDPLVLKALQHCLELVQESATARN